MLASGQGTNLANIHTRIQAGLLTGCEIALVISNNSTSGAIEYARSNSLSWEHFSLRKLNEDVQAYEDGFLRLLSSKAIDIIVLAGYMKKLPDVIVGKFENRIINVHPALLPAFGGSAMYGLRVHEAVLARGCKLSGATVHLVNEHYDEGPILLQRSCEVAEDDTAETLQRRVAAIEYELLPRGIELLVHERVRVVGPRAIIEDQRIS